MSLQLTGTVKKIGEEQTGEGGKGKWTKRTMLLEYMNGNYPKTVEFTGMNKGAEAIGTLGVGETATVHFDLESREYNGKYYTSANVWKVS
jgi:hypothetical protein